MPLIGKPTCWNCSDIPSSTTGKLFDLQTCFYIKFLLKCILLKNIHFIILDIKEFDNMNSEMFKSNLKLKRSCIKTYHLHRRQDISHWS